MKYLILYTLYSFFLNESKIEYIIPRVALHGGIGMYRSNKTNITLNINYNKI